jgi:hypothetical protein
MRIIHRRLIFWMFFFLFLAVSPLVIYYSQGFRYDKYHGIFIHSGSVTIKSLPTSVNVYLNNDLQPTKSLDIINNSITLNGLRPGSYTLRVSADGYQDWEKKVEVHSGISTEFWNVVLLPKSAKLQELEASDIERFFPSPFGKRVTFIKSNENQFQIWFLDVSENNPQMIYSSENIKFPDDKLENLEWNFKESYIVSPIIRDNQKDYLVASADLDIDPFFLSETTNLKGLEKARWSSKEKGVIYFLAKSDGKTSADLYKLDVASKETSLVIEDIRAYDFSSSSLYFIRSNNILYDSDLSGENISQITFSPFTENEIGSEARLIVFDKNRQALVTKNGELFVRNKATEDTVQKLGDNIAGVQFSDDGKKLLFWNKNEIDVLFLKEWETQPRRKENETQQIIRFSSNIDNVFWYRDYEHVFFTNQNKIKMIGLDPQDHRVLMDVFNNNLNEFPATYDSGNGRYYFVREANKQKTLNYIDIPEKTGFFQ